VLTLGPLRPGAIDQLGSSPQFLLENLLGLLSGTLLAAVGFRLCIPGSGGPLRSPWILVVPLACLGAAAGALPGLMMQLACMYEASHTLAFHLGPIGLLALVGALLGRRLLNAI
jgi:hypothetical protein